MSWNSLIRPSAAIVAMAIAGAGIAPALAKTIIVRSSGPSMAAYPPGKPLPDSSRIMLKANDQVVILDSRGTRTLRGPGTFSPVVSANQPTDLRATFADASGRRARPGAVRGIAPAVAGTPRSPNIWFVDIARSSTACVTDPTRVTLWRPDRAADGTMTVSGANGATAAIKWTAGESAQMWPATLPVAQGATYRLAMPGMAEPTMVKFAVLGPNPTGLEGMASALIQNHCTAQLDLLIETVAIPDAAAPAG